MPKITMSLNEDSIDNAIIELKKYKDKIAEKTKDLCEQLAYLGATQASISYARSALDPIDITVEPTENGYKIVASGEQVAFIEFGTGKRYGYGHPGLNTTPQIPTGPGSYQPAKGRKVNGIYYENWENPYGWYKPDGIHTYGNAPAMGMYNAQKAIREEVERVAKEVFSKW